MDPRITRKYALKKEIGRGASGIVYLAEHKQLGVLKAIKELTPKTEEERRRVQREIKFLQQAQHPHVIKIDEVFTSEQVTYICMEYAEGGSLEKKLNHHVPRQESLAITLDILKGVQALHAKGIIHRDLKPGNILFNNQGKAKIGDFGVAKASTNVSRLTKTGKTLGTIGYMSPEQLLGKKGEIAESSDVYAVGVMLYEMLTGEHPFKGKDHMETVARSIHGRYIIPLEEYKIDTILKTICYKAIHKSKLKRYQQASEMLEELSIYYLRNEGDKKEWVSRSLVKKIQMGFVGVMSGVVLIGGGLGIGRGFESPQYIWQQISREYNFLSSDHKKEKVFRIAQKNTQREIYNGLQEGNENNITEKILQGEELCRLGEIYYDGKGVQRDYQKAKELFEKASKLGNSDAIYSLGNIYCFGMGVEKKYVKAKELYEKAAELGNSGAMVNLGTIYRLGLGVQKDHLKEKELYERAIEVGDSKGMVCLGYMYANGHGVVLNYKKAKELYERAANLGNTFAMTKLGAMYNYGKGVEKNYIKAVKLYEKAFELGDRDAICELGMMYYRGHGVEKNYEKAKELYKIGMKLGDSNAIGAYGMMYYHGHGVERNYNRARNLFKKSVSLGNANSMNFLGMMYYEGDGVEKNYLKAKELFEKATELRHPYSISNLGAMYHYGHGVDINYAKAKELYEKAILLGESTAMNNLGFMYERGIGVKVNYGKARELYKKGIKFGNHNSVKYLRRLEEKIKK